jgi:4'-phosphopantetheinyl transferase EntD
MVSRAAPVIRRICPPTVRVVETNIDVASVALFPEEVAAIASSVDKRRREFATVRWCARTALAELGVQPAPLVPGERGAPDWPEGVVGSMTHCEGLRAAAVARRRDVVTLGIDAEPDAALPDGVLRIVALPGELEALPDGGTVSWDRLLFCVKEAVYKAWFPLARRFLGFHEATVAIDESGTFTAQLLVPGPRVGDVEMTGFTGRWIAENGLLASAIVAVCPERGDARRRERPAVSAETGTGSPTRGPESYFLTKVR